MKEYEAELAEYERKCSFVFSHRLPPLLICLMQLLASCITEIMNILVICSSGTVMDVVMDYIALEIIACIDNIYADAVRSRITSEISENEDEF